MACERPCLLPGWRNGCKADVFGLAVGIDVRISVRADEGLGLGSGEGPTDTLIDCSPVGHGCISRHSAVGPVVGWLVNDSSTGFQAGPAINKAALLGLSVGMDIGSTVRADERLGRGSFEGRTDGPI